MKWNPRTLLACLVFATVLAAVSSPLAAQNVPSSDLLLPYFEVDAANPGGLTTLFAVGNATDEPVDVLATVYTNWGIPILEVPFTLKAREVRTVNLRDWFRTGGSPTKALAAPELKHLAAAASGQRSPKDNLYYSTEIRPDLQVGYVTLRTQGGRPDALWGDWFNVDVAGNLARGDVLANIDRSTGCPGLCQRHLLRYLSGGGFDGGTEIVIWRQTQGKPSANPNGGVKMQADATALSEPGEAVENRQLALLPVEKVLISDLKLEESFGSLDLESETETFIAVQHTSESRYSIGLTTYCLPRKTRPGPGIEILKLTNGEDADAAPGPSLPIGSKVTWEYLVSNIGDVELTDIVVEDDQEGRVTCPDDTLAPGESMTCAATGTAKACQYTNIGSVSGVSPSGTTVGDSDTSHYFGDDGAALALSAILLNGESAGSELDPVRVKKEGDTLNWIFKIANTGKVRLTGIQLTGIGAACPKGALEPGESMECTATGKAALPIGKHSLPVSATGRSSCSEASAAGVGYYTVPESECVASPAIQIEKSTNGQDADTAPGPQIPVGSPVTWTYVVTNTGDVALTGVKVTDDKGVAVSCPKTALQAGESMTCTGSGTAQPGQYRNVGAVTGTPPCGNPVSDDDPSHYYGTTPGLAIVKLTNGHDANTAPGPEIPVGSAIIWEYRVTNTGNVTLGNVKVTDDKGVAVSCPKTSLQAGESMTCTGSGKAQACQYMNLGTVTGKTPGGDTLSASDPSHYYGTTQPAIDVEATVNGQDADSPKGPEVLVGSALGFTYTVTNTGDTALTGVQVSDSQGVAVSCPKTALAAGESMTCTGSGSAQSGQYSAVGSAKGTGACGRQVNDSDPVHYFGFIPTGNEGCTPGYWKNHTDSWPAAGYSPSQKVQSVFGQASLYPSLGSSTLLQALSFDGGSDLTGAAGILLRASTAALLNSAHSGVDYPWVSAQVISDVDAALASSHRDTILALASKLDQDNNLGCPLN